MEKDAWMALNGVSSCRCRFMVVVVFVVLLEKDEWMALNGTSIGSCRYIVVVVFVVLVFGVCVGNIVVLLLA